MIYGYSREQGFYWLPKSIQVGDANWRSAVIKSPTCPDQRKYRRLNRTERVKYEDR